MKAFSKDLPQQRLVPLLLLAILLLALLLRIFQLDTESLWLDEVTSVDIADQNLIRVLERSLVDRNPPLYYLVLHCWMQLFGDSEFSVRLPSVLFGVLSVAMLYKIGTLLFNKWTGLISALLMAVSANQIYYSQEARAFSMMVLLTLISFYFFWKLFEGKNYWILAGYALSSAALMYSHYYGILLIFAQALFVLGFYAHRRHQNNTTPFGIWGLAAGAIALLYIPGFYYLAYMLIHPFSSKWTERLSAIITGLFQYPTAPDSPSSPLLLAIFTLFALIAVCVLAMKRGERTALSLLLLWLIVPVALPLLLSQILHLPYVARYLIPALPALYLLVAVGMQRAGSAAIRASSTLNPVTLAGLAVTAVLFPLMGALYLSTLHDYFTRVTKEQWRDVASYIKTYAEPQDVMVISHEYMTKSYNYYARGNDLPDSMIPLPPEKVNDVEYEVGGANRVWLLLSHIEEEQQEQFKANVQGASFKVADRKQYNGINLTLYENE